MEKALHQDAPYFYHRDHRFVTGFLHLVATNDENGGLHVVPASFRLGLLEHVDTFSHLALPSEQFPLDCAVPVYAEPGDVVFFNYLTIHGSGVNRSSGPRPALCMQYRSADDRLQWAHASTVDGLGRPPDDTQKNRRGSIVCGSRIN
jgi:phytanoyl-CoA hydroxylase